MPKYEVLSEFCRDYTSLHPYDIPSPSYSVNELIISSNVDVYTKKETYVVELCHKKFEHVCQPLDEGHLMENFPCETHLLSGSLKEDREKLMEFMNNFVDINSLVTRCCWKASKGEEDFILPLNLNERLDHIFFLIDFHKHLQICFFLMVVLHMRFLQHIQSSYYHVHMILFHAIWWVWYIHLFSKFVNPQP